MQLLLSFILSFGGIALYFALLRFGIYRLYPVETYILMLLGVVIAFSAARRRPGYLRYAIVGIHGFLLCIILGWTLIYSRLPIHPLPVRVGQAMPAFSLPDQDGRLYSTGGSQGKTAALYIFYRGDW